MLTLPPMKVRVQLSLNRPPALRTVVEIQFVPDFLLKNKAVECVAVQSGDSAALDPRLESMALNFGWTFKDDEARFDVDSSLALFRKDFTAVDFVWWDHRASRCGAVHFLSHDNKEGTGSGTKESINVKLNKIPDAVHYLVVVVSVYSKDHDIEDIRDISLSVENPSNERLVDYKVVYGAFWESVFDVTCR